MRLRVQDSGTRGTKGTRKRDNFTYILPTFGYPELTKYIDFAGNFGYWANGFKPRSFHQSLSRLKRNRVKALHFVR